MTIAVLVSCFKDLVCVLLGLQVAVFREDTHDFITIDHAIAILVQHAEDLLHVLLGCQHPLIYRAGDELVVVNPTLARVDEGQQVLELGHRGGRQAALVFSRYLSSSSMDK